MRGKWWIIFFILILILILLVVPIKLEQFKNFDQVPVIGIVSLIKDPHQIQTWIDYHISIGVSRFYLFLDDPNDINLISYLKTKPQVTTVLITDDWKQKNGYIDKPEKDNPLNWNVRQDLAVKNGLELAEKDQVDILVHIDCDELIYIENSSHKLLPPIFAKYNNYTIFRFKNIEIAPDRNNYKNCFKEAHYFRTNGKNFIAYGNGKSGGKVGEVEPFGPHFMRAKNKETAKQVEIPELVILHYVSCNIEETLKKYKMYGNFKTDQWEWAKYHLSARDTLHSCKSIESCTKEAEKLFTQRMKDPNEPYKFIKLKL